MYRRPPQPQTPGPHSNHFPSFQDLSLEEIDRIVDEERRLNKEAMAAAARWRAELDDEIVALRLRTDRILRSLRRRS